MKRFWWIALCLITSHAWAGEVKVRCPEELHWSSEGYCMLEFDKITKGTCPRGSHLAQMGVTAPRICMSKGSCPDGMRPTGRGVCAKG